MNNQHVEGGKARLSGDEARSTRVELGPVLRESGEVVLSDDVVFIRGCRVETVENHADEQIHKHVGDGQGETGWRGWGGEGNVEAEEDAPSCLAIVCVFMWEGKGEVVESMGLAAVRSGRPSGGTFRPDGAKCTTFGSIVDRPLRTRERTRTAFLSLGV